MTDQTEPPRDPERTRFERKMKTWDLALKSLSTTIAVVGVILAVYKIVSADAQRAAEQTASLRHQVLEFELKQREKFSDVCGRVVDATGSIARASSRDAAKDDLRVFWQLFGGQLCLYEGDEVKNAMNAFSAGLAPWDAGPAPRNLMALSVDLARKCRKELDDKKREAFTLADPPAPRR